MNAYNVSFFWKEKREIVVYSDDIPQNKMEAEGLTWGGIRLWFQEQALNIPDIVRNVQFENVKEFHWDILPLT